MLDHLDEKFFLNLTHASFIAILLSLVFFVEVFPRLGFLELSGHILRDLFAVCVALLAGGGFLFDQHKNFCISRK